jgi:mono/diheme cytochrome c family protein
MLYVRLPLLLLIGALGLGLMGGVLMAQQPENTHTAIDCSPAALAALMQGTNERFPMDFASDIVEATANLYMRGLVYQHIASDCVNTGSETTQTTAPILNDAAPGAVSEPQIVGDDPLEALTQMQTLIGDPAHGSALFSGEARTSSNTVLGCSACHTGGAVAPATEKIWDRTVTTRLKLPMFSTYTPEHYIVESIIRPDAYVTAGYMVSMPHDFGERLLPQDLADLVAYLHSLSAESISPQ